MLLDHNSPDGARTAFSPLGFASRDRRPRHIKRDSPGLRGLLVVGRPPFDLKMVEVLLQPHIIWGEKVWQSQAR